ncbi:MAG: tetratricopeptide repeat protein [bacterium]|nr:MAG: tetratricopeptide repeat protein [bacterium]
MLKNRVWVSWGVFFLLLAVLVLETGCWGRKFFRMPRETIDTSAKVDSLLKENMNLQRRVYLLENELKKQQDYNRSVSAQNKIDLEELKDQLNALQQLLREAVPGMSIPIPAGRELKPDTAGEGVPFGELGRVGGESDEGVEEDDDRADASDAGVLSEPSDSIPGADVEGIRSPDSDRDAGARTVPPPDEIHRQVYLDFSRREYQLALEESDLFLSGYPDHPLGEEVRLIRGECFMEQDEYFDAIKEFSILLQKYPHGQKIPAALFRMAVSYERIDEREIAAGVVRRLIREHPYSEEASAAKERFADLLNE